jgi:hypothetical protein
VKVPFIPSMQLARVVYVEAELRCASLHRLTPSCQVSSTSSCHASTLSKTEVLLTPLEYPWQSKNEQKCFPGLQVWWTVPLNVWHLA